MKLTPARAFAPALVVLALALGAGCSSGDDSASGSSSSDVAAGSAGMDAPEAAPSRADGLFSTADSASVRSVAEEPAPADVERSLIKHGNVALRADDVGKAQFAVQKVVDAYAGQVTEEKTTTDDDGHPAYTRMVLRIPADHFDDAMADLKGVAELESANTSEDDVTTKVIDVQTRLAVQKRSIARITTLFERAESIRDIMAIEAQLSRRQAVLDSLEKQAAYLSSQTTLSTITVSVDQIPEKKAVVAADDDSGFVSGLTAGWDALTTFAVGAATVVGALLPWVVVVAVIGPPVLLLVRSIRRRRSRTGRTPSAA
ncbi:DUF4349 domain-containing protein [Nocardioides sp. CN2-186]|uniref:DUF4349 domain-containing protein n=1 Tax=Nocardioides tweenelious TaxID=3156607 RepID=UPI0032B59053